MTKRMSSILDGYPVPPDFDKYCLKLFRTKEIDSVKKLKDFWLYAIEVGKKYGPEYRDAIADWAIFIGHFATRIPGLKSIGMSKDVDLLMARDMFETYCPSSSCGYTSDEMWGMMEEYVKNIETNKWRYIKKVYFDVAPWRLKRYFRR